MHPILIELREHPLRTFVLLLCILGGLVHQATRWGWFIDDAAICFSYARNLADGLGAVPWPGGERIEAYSDPTWVAILTLAELVGLDGFTVAKPLAMGFGVGTTWLVWRTAVLALPGHRGPGALIAPIALALSSQFAIWSASGLENGLFCLLVAGAVHRTAREVRDGGRPWSALLYLVLTWTRPEGVLYAGVGAVVLLGSRTRTPRWVASWLAILVFPSIALELARIAYFASPVPNTAYAKIAARGLAPLDFERRGWLQAREWADRLWYGYWTPILLLGLTGMDRRRSLVGVTVLVLLAASLLWPGIDDLRALALWPVLPPPPEAFVLVRAVALVAAGAGLPLLAIGLPDAPVRLLCGWTAFTAVFFGIFADGDWMGGYRWMSFGMPAISVLLAIGIAPLIDAFEERISGATTWGPTGTLLASVAVGLLIPPNFSQTRDHALWNTNETTSSVKLRVDYTRSILRRTFWEEPVVHIEVDMGAHLWWAPDYHALDMAMLVDVPMARHWFQQRAFVREYFFQEHQATFAHVGGWWALHSGLRRYPEWEPAFFELPGYQDRPPYGIFRNVFARREMVLAPSWEGTADRRAVFAGRVALAGVEVPAPWTPGQPGYLEAPFELLAPRGERRPVRLIAFLSDGSGVRASWDLPLGYGIYPWEQWKVGQVFRGRHAVPVPSGLPPGRYDLGFVVLGANGQVLAAEEPSSDPVFAVGEVRFSALVEVTAGDELAARTETARTDIARLAGAGSCEPAEAAWIRLKRHRPMAWTWHEQERGPASAALARCWVERAAVDPTRADEHLARAHRWDPGEASLLAAADTLADVQTAEGRQAMARRDWETAYQKFSAVLRYAPTRAWARRWAEQARDQRLGLTEDVRIGIGGENNLRELEERRAPPAQ